MKILTQDHFKEMPWSNGGGTTTELYSLQTPFVFRLSVARVEKDGPFSLFPMIDRTLILLSGNGFSLKKESETIRVDKKFIPLHFLGEDVINCSLINGPCKDFNVMIDRRWGKCKTQVMNRDTDISIFANNSLKFVFDFDSFQLWQIENEDKVDFVQKTNAPLIVVNVYAN